MHTDTDVDRTEHQMATRKCRGEDALDPEQPSLPPSEANEHLVEIPGVQRSLISLTGRAFERALLWRLDWYNLMYAPPTRPPTSSHLVEQCTAIDVYRRVLALVASGYRTEAVTIIGQQVMAPRGLIGLGQDTLDSSTAEVREIFELLVSPAAYPVLVHCTQGKDRTGLIVLLLLLLLPEVSADAIAADYVKSEPELVVEFEERMKEIRVLGLNEEYTKCPPEFTQQIRAHLDAKYGGVGGYLTSVGIDREKQELIRQQLLA
ncbi:tyrosine/serine protein phosphatase, putative [Aspergillus fumigatus A1163]|uniref:Tyrosine/serine protein phosphatase, putative n=2 Tax=Aspergillus fumigatus TaxID=746128 RepID=Q4WNE5_ASPFU|nr:tyrosine/serine protein phosphatase, putative [Aspergillus fumigatus Af293]EAL88519.1 tyrosine/serine protein phosphatase, putative [Aspergillus fumigatus Af293]EDP49232.1 tyrosine/serine protein phosphatase, putative [Aspergillus fumigatus A1163]